MLRIARDTEIGHVVKGKFQMEMSAEVISLVIGVASFVAAVIFFFAARKSEIHTVELLSKIGVQANTLERINDNLLGYAIHHLAKSNDRIIDNLLPRTQLETSNLANKEGGLQDMIENQIMIYYYTARANYFARLFRSNVPLTEENKAIHVAADEAIAASFSDFKVASTWFNSVRTDELEKNRLYRFAVETKKEWEPLVANEA